MHSSEAAAMQRRRRDAELVVRGLIVRQHI